MEVERIIRNFVFLKQKKLKKDKNCALRGHYFKVLSLIEVEKKMKNLRIIQ